MMTAAVRPYLTAGVALAGAGLIAVTPVAPVASPPKPDFANLDVTLTAGEDFSISDLFNIPVNLFIDFFNIPYVLFSAPYSVEGLIPDFTTEEQYTPPQELWPNYAGPFDTTNPDDTFSGALNFLAGSLDYTGSWLESFPTQAWGWDTANPWNASALVDVLTPWARLGPSVEDNPIANNVNEWFEAESPPADPGNVIFFHDVIGELMSQFSVPLSKLTTGDGYYLEPDNYINHVGHGAGPLGHGGEPYHEIWSGTHAQVDPSFGLDAYMESLLQEPSANPLRLPDLDDIYPTLVHLYHAINVDFDPLYPGTDSFIFQAAEKLYGIPALINGLFNAEHGLFGPDFPDIIPESVWKPLGEALASVIGPDTALAENLSDLAGRLQALTEGLLRVFLPTSDSLYESPSEVLSQVFSPGAVNAAGTDIETVFDNSDIEFFNGTPPLETDIVNALVDTPSTDILGGNVSPDDVSDALANVGISLNAYDFDAGDLAGALNGADASTFIGDLIGDLFG